MVNLTKAARNVELKAAVTDPVRVAETADRLATSSQQSLRQLDTYFHCMQGRLKLREIWTPAESPPSLVASHAADCLVAPGDPPGRVELIWYMRSDEAGPKTSHYIQAPITSPHDAVKQALSAAWGVRAVVDKWRTLWFWNNVRLHLDRVANLGDFLEFEAVLSPDQSVEEGERQLAWLMEQFSLMPTDLVQGSYADLIASN